MRTTDYIQWYNENEGRNYPLLDTALNRDDRGVSIPANILVDLRIALPDTYSDVYCSYIKVSAYTVSISFSCRQGGLLIGTFLRTNIIPYRAYALTSIVDDVSGWVVFGSYLTYTDTCLSRFSQPEQSLIVPRCLDYTESIPVKRIIKLGEQHVSYVDGVISLIGQGGLIIKRHETDPNIIVMELDNPEGFAGPCNSKLDTDLRNVSLHSINNVKPDSSGQITIRLE